MLPREILKFKSSAVMQFPAFWGMMVEGLIPYKPFLFKAISLNKDYASFIYVQVTCFVCLFFSQVRKRAPQESDVDFTYLSDVDLPISST